MKQWYFFSFAVIVFVSANIPKNSLAQPCSCAGGEPIDSIVHNVYLDSVTLFFTNVAFPKFDPATGSLSCVSVRANVLTVSSLRIANREGFPVDYELDYSRNSIINGPGINSMRSRTRHYGPFTLGPVGDPDTVVYVGPDTIFNNSFQSTTTSNVVPYTGATGTVSISYGNTYGYTWWQGSNNAGLDVATYSRVNLNLVYYWCPNEVLPSGIRNFSATRKGKNVELQWISENENLLNSYSIEFSRNGSEFRASGKLVASGIGTRSYFYQYDGSAETGRIFFRIRQVDSRGKTRYSPIKSVSFNENGVLNPSIYPNPASRSLFIQFESAQTGTILIDLINSSGQVLENNKLNVDKINNLELNFRSQYAHGMYWLRIMNQNTGEKSVIRVTIR